MLILDFSNKIDVASLPKNEEWQQNIVDFLIEWYSESEFIVTKTSGSTGVPKEIKLAKKAMWQSAEMTVNFLDLKSGDTALLCMPPLYIAGKMMLLRAIVRKLKLYCIKPSAHPLENINEKIVFSAMTPMQVENSVSRLPLIHKLIIGGAQVAYSLVEKIKGLETQIYESFGMTETISHIALKRISGSKDNNYFKLMPHIKIKEDQRGCLCIKPVFLEEEIVTNDIVKIISDTEFEWLGRKDHVINSGGIKIFPEKVERQLKSILNSEFIISSVPDPKLGEKVILIIEGEKEQQQEERIYNFTFENKYEKPREILYIKQFEKTPTGKILRKAIKTLKD